MEKSYKIFEICEVYEYKVTDFYPGTDEGGLFVDYINTFRKLNAEASGSPAVSEALRMRSGMSKRFGRVKESV